MYSKKSTRMIQEQWRKLGFYYDLDEKVAKWKLVGSRDGLFEFCRLLRDYSSKSSNIQVSEHEHYGPYRYLEVMTWPVAGIDSHSIHGSLSDLERLAALLEQLLSNATSGESIEIREEYSKDAKYSIELDVKEDGFDPASADSLLQ